MHTGIPSCALPPNSHGFLLELMELLEGTDLNVELLSLGDDSLSLLIAEKCCLALPLPPPKVLPGHEFCSSFLYGLDFTSVLRDLQEKREEWQETEVLLVHKTCL